jgi:hypothetical protein
MNDQKYSEGFNKLRKNSDQQISEFENIKKALGFEDDTAVCIITMVSHVDELYATFIREAENKNIRLTYMISRAIFETILNVNYMMASGEKEFSRARMHAIQKRFRTKNKKLESVTGLKDVAAQGDLELLNYVETFISLQEYTSKSGKEITHWTKENLIDRLRTIYKFFGSKASTPLEIYMWTYYDNSSEILHGTMYGASYSLGVTSIRPTLEDVERIPRIIRRDLLFLTFCMMLCVRSLIFAVYKKFDLLDKFLESEMLIEDAKKWMKDNFLENLDN